MGKKALFATDLHGIRTAYDRLFAVAEERGIEKIILGGDLTPKRVAIKLVGGEVLPVPLLREGRDGTYLEPLQRIVKMNKESVDLEKQEIENGALIYEEENAFYALDDMLIEQGMVRKLFAYLRSEDKKGEPLRFNRDEADYFDSLLIIQEEIEQCLGEEHRQVLERSLRDKILGFNEKAKKFTFADVAPSKNLRLYYEGAQEWAALLQLKEQLMGQIQDHPQRRLVGKALEKMLIEATRAKTLVQYAYQPDHFREAVQDTGVGSLKNRAMAPETIIAGQRAFLEGYLREKLKLLGQVHSGKRYTSMAEKVIDKVVNTDYIHVVSSMMRSRLMRRIENGGGMTYQELTRGI